MIGTVVGSLVARIPTLRAAFGSLITGLQTMPSIAWFPLAILIFQLSERAILFVVVLGAAPSIANGLITGADNVPPILLRAGRVLGARGLAAYRYVVLPASLPSFVGGLKQGWAFAWRSLMAGELLVVIRGQGVGRVPPDPEPCRQQLVGPARHHDRDPGDRHPGRLPALRHAGAGHPPPLGTARGGPLTARHALGL